MAFRVLICFLMEGIHEEVWEELRQKLQSRTDQGIFPDQVHSSQVQEASVGQTLILTLASEGILWKLPRNKASILSNRAHSYKSQPFRVEIYSGLLSALLPGRSASASIRPYNTQASRHKVIILSST